MTRLRVALVLSIGLLAVAGGESGDGASAYVDKPRAWILVITESKHV